MYSITRHVLDVSSNCSRSGIDLDGCQDRAASSAVLSRPSLLFRAITSVGLVSIWKSRRASAVIFDIRVDDPQTGLQIEHHHIVRSVPNPLTHIICSANGPSIFRFDEREPDAAEHQP